MRLGPLRDASTRVLWLVPVAATLLAGVLSNVAPLAPLEDLSRDWRFRVRGVRQPTVPITIVAIDEASLSSPQLKEPLLFWGKHHARAFRILKAGGARAVGLDLIQPLSLVDLDLLESNPDLEQAQALATMPNVVLAFARSLDAQGNISDTLPNEQLMGALAVGGGREGFVNFSEEADGVVRRYTLVDTDKSLSFSLALAATAAGQEPVAAARSLKLGRHQIPLDEEQACLINYRGPDRTFARISYADLLARPAKYRAQIKNSICLIGLTSFVLQDYHLSPFRTTNTGANAEPSNLMAGIEVHANVIHTLLSGQGIHRTTPRAVWGLIALAVLLTAPLFWRAPVWAVLPGGALLAALWIGACQWAFARYDWQLPLVPVVFALALNGAGLSLARLRAEGQQKKHIEDMMGRYVSQPVLDYFKANPNEVELGGRRQEVTVLFSDIRSFTEMSEKMEPEQVTAFLNRYLSAMVAIIFEHGGTVDKYIGDGIMAVWNWPVAQPDHALRAVRAAIAMQEAVASTSPQWREGGGAIRVGIGVHTGPAILGNIGSPRRMERTAIGDTVNVTSRLEALNKTLGPKWNTGVLLSQTTKEAMGVSLVHADYRLQNVGATEIRGRTESLEIHAIIRQDAKE